MLGNFWLSEPVIQAPPMVIGGAFLCVPVRLCGLSTCTGHPPWVGHNGQGRDMLGNTNSVNQIGAAINAREAARRWECVGAVRGACGILHRSERAANHCCKRDGAGCRSQGGYSDRRPVLVEVSK